LGHLRVSRLSYNNTVLRDSNDESNFYKSIELDCNGRMGSITFGLRRKEMLSIKLSYDIFNRLSKKITVNHEGRPSEENYSYTLDGFLIKVWGPDNYGYR